MHTQFRPGLSEGSVLQTSSCGQVGCRHWIRRKTPPGVVAGTVLSRPNLYSKVEYHVSVAVNLYHVLKFRVRHDGHSLRKRLCKFQCQAHATLMQQRELIFFAQIGSQVELSQWEVISEVNQYFAISSRNICVWQVPLFFGRGSDNSVDELPVHFHLSWSYGVAHSDKYSSAILCPY